MITEFQKNVSRISEIGVFKLGGDPVLGGGELAVLFLNIAPRALPQQASQHGAAPSALPLETGASMRGWSALRWPFVQPLGTLWTEGLSSQQAWLTVRDTGIFVAALKQIQRRCVFFLIS